VDGILREVERKEGRKEVQRRGNAIEREQEGGA
jgi:hypothetical protein